jgi:integrase
VALSTGLREGELLALRWSDVDLREGHLQVTRTLHYLTNKGLQFGEPKTRRSRRRVALSKETARVLTIHRTRQLERRLLLGGSYVDNDLIFATELGEPVKPYSIAPRFKRITRKAKLGQMRFHDLRHTSASLLLAAGVHPKVVSERLGHSTVNLTLDTYSHVLPGLQEQAAQSMDAYLPKAR